MPTPIIPHVSNASCAVNLPVGIAVNVRVVASGIVVNAGIQTTRILNFGSAAVAANTFAP